MEKISQIAKAHNLKIVEDAAQAHGAYEKNTTQKAGTYGDCSGFSFYPGKNLGCFGDGGCISTNNDEIAKKLRMMRNYGSEIRYQHDITAGNSRLDELQAGILSIKLKKLDEWGDRRQKIAKLYLQELKNINHLTLPEYHPGHAWHVFAIRTKNRSELQAYLTNASIGTNIHYPTPIHLQGAYKYMNLPQGSFPYTESICNEVLSLPIGPHLSVDEADYVATKIKAFFA
jgi:dTDP-4-amino-4,6-dideoxygalactose transaminase